MSAATSDLNTPRRDTNQVNLDVAASTTLYAGTMVAVNTSGNAVAAANTAGLRVIGCALEYVDNSTGAAADLDVEVSRGCHRYNNSGTSALVDDDIGKPCFVEDDNTVAAAPGSGAVIAGIVHDVDSDGVWVDHSAYVDDKTAGLYVLVANADPANGNATITIQSAHRGRQVAQAWFSATAYGAPTDLGTLTATTGTLLVENTDDAIASLVTDATGLAVLNLDTAANGTVHAMVEINGICATDSEAITGN